MTAAKLGETVGVSESTVVRFAYALGLDGYPALQDRMQEMVLGRLTSVQRAQLASGIKKNEVFKTVLTTDMNSIRTTMEMADEEQFDEAVESIQNARKGSTLILVAVFGSRADVDLAKLNDSELDLNTSMMYRHEDYADAIRLVSEGKIRLAPLMSRHFAFRDFLAAYKYIDENREKTMKVIVDVQN